MRVTIMYRNNFDGGDGWEFYPETIEIADNCPVCGQRRGTPYEYSFCEDGEWFSVDKWDNPCGHLDFYGECLTEARHIVASAAREADEIAELEFQVKQHEKRDADRFVTNLTTD